MAECPICATPYQEGSSKTCSHCGFDLTPYPQTLGQIPTAYLEKEENQLESVRQMWVRFEETKQKLLENLTTQTENHAQEISSLNSQLDHSHHTIIELENDAFKVLEELEAKIKDLEAEKKVIQEDSNEKEQIISQLNKNIADLEIDKINLKQELAQEIDSLKYKKSQTKNELNQSNLLIATLNNQIQELNTEKDNLQKRLIEKEEQFTSEKKTLNNNIREANKTIKNLKFEKEMGVKYKEQKINELEEETYQIKKQLADNIDEIQYLQKTNKELTNNINQDSRSYKQKVTEIKQLNQQIEQLQREKRQLVIDRQNYWSSRATAVTITLSLIFIFVLAIQSNNQNIVSRGNTTNYSNRGNTTNNNNHTIQQNTNNSSSNIFDNQSFPQSVCGDAMPTDISTFPLNFYPVFVSYSEQNLQLVRNSFCRDAIQIRRGNTNQQSIQVGSFRNYERAEQFKDFLYRKIGSGEVGEPNYYERPPN